MNGERSRVFRIRLAHSAPGGSNLPEGVKYQQIQKCPLRVRPKRTSFF